MVLLHLDKRIKMYVGKVRKHAAAQAIANVQQQQNIFTTPKPPENTSHNSLFVRELNTLQ